jgi:hypothetical protein
MSVECPVCKMVNGLRRSSCRSCVGKISSRISRLVYWIEWRDSRGGPKKRRRLSGMTLVASVVELERAKNGSFSGR